MNQRKVIVTIQQAGRERELLWIKVMEADGSIEPREVKPYSFRPIGTFERFFCYDPARNGTRSFKTVNIIEVLVTKKPFVARFPVEF